MQYFRKKKWALLGIFIFGYVLWKIFVQIKMLPYSLFSENKMIFGALLLSFAGLLAHFISISTLLAVPKELEMAVLILGIFLSLFFVMKDFEQNVKNAKNKDKTQKNMQRAFNKYRKEKKIDKVIGELGLIQTREQCRKAEELLQRAKRTRDIEIKNRIVKYLARILSEDEQKGTENLKELIEKRKSELEERNK